jgi:hypothetical protein
MNKNTIPLQGFFIKNDLDHEKIIDFFNDFNRCKRNY